MAWVPYSLRYIDVSDLSMARLDLGTLSGLKCPVLKGVAEPVEVWRSGVRFGRLWRGRWRWGGWSCVGRRREDGGGLYV